MSSSGFLIAEALSEVLRKPYHQGDMDITVRYLVEGLSVGSYRVMLKKNFDTACWIPPVGKRASHSIYYGDRMLARIVDQFVKVHEITMPKAEDFAAEIKAELEAALKSKKAGTKVATPKMPPQTMLLDKQMHWLKENLTAPHWEKFTGWLLKAVASYGRHERQHARHTPRDLKVVTADLAALGIPFSYFNLFEDARIEYLSRLELNEPFEWTLFEELAPMNNPLNLFLRCIQLEGAQDTVALDSEDEYKPRPSLTVGHIAQEVEDYYARACKCTTAEQLYPIISEFIAEFKDDLPPPPPPPGGSKGKGTPGAAGAPGGSGTPTSGTGSDPDGEGEDDDDDSGAGERAGDLSTAAEAADEGDDFFTEFDADASVVGGTDPEGKAADEEARAKVKGDGKSPPPKGGKTKGNSQGIPDSIAPQASGGRAADRDFLANRAGKIDDEYAKRVDHLTSMLMRMFKTHNLPAALENPGHRISGRHLARNELRFVHKRVFGGKGKRKYSIVFDCSGSMNGRPAREGKLLLLALNNLARKGYLEGSLILSGWVGGRPGWLSYPFPVSNEVIMRIETGHGSEGIQDALKDNLPSIKGMDDVFVYTDACICDAPLNRDFFASKRIWPVGLYVGSTERASEMERHFPQNIIRDTIEQVVEAMLTRNRRTVG